jgi:hypothetical protein
VGCELTHCAVDSKQASSVRVRVRAAARQTDPQVHALQYSTAHTHPPGANTAVSAVIAPLPTTQHARIRTRQAAAASPVALPVLSTSHLTLPDYARPTDRTAGCHLFLPAR